MNRIIRVLHWIDVFLYDVLVRNESAWDRHTPEQLLLMRVKAGIGR